MGDGQLDAVLARLEVDPLELEPIGMADFVDVLWIGCQSAGSDVGVAGDLVSGFEVVLVVVEERRAGGAAKAQDEHAAARREDQPARRLPANDRRAEACVPDAILGPEAAAEERAVRQARRPRDDALAESGAPELGTQPDRANCSLRCGRDDRLALCILGDDDAADDGRIRLS